MPKFLSELPIEPLTHQASIRLRHRVCVRTYVRRTERAYVTVRRPSVVRTESGVEVEFGGRELRARFGGFLLEDSFGGTGSCGQVQVELSWGGDSSWFHAVVRVAG